MNSFMSHLQELHTEIIFASDKWSSSPLVHHDFISKDVQFQGFLIVILDFSLQSSCWSLIWGKEWHSYGGGRCSDIGTGSLWAGFLCGLLDHVAQWYLDGKDGKEDHISMYSRKKCEAKSNEKSYRRLVNLTGNGLGQNIMFEFTFIPTNYFEENAPNLSSIKDINVWRVFPPDGKDECWSSSHLPPPHPSTTTEVTPRKILFGFCQYCWDLWFIVSVIETGLDLLVREDWGREMAVGGRGEGEAVMNESGQTNRQRAWT